MGAFNEQMSALANSIRTKAGVTSAMTISAMKVAVDNIETGGGGGDIGKLVDRTIESVVIPASTSLIGQYVFAGCSNLSSVTILEGCRSIQGSAFWSCTELSSIEIPKSVQSMCAGAFGRCSSMSVVSMGLNVTMSDANAVFSGLSNIHLIISSNSSDYTRIVSGKFQGHSWFGRVTIPNSVSAIYDYAFMSCGISRVTFGSNITQFGNYAFASCYKLQSAVLPSGIVNIPAGCFWSCGNMKYVSMSDDVSAIQSDAFADCYSMIVVNGDYESERTSSIFPSSLIVIGPYSFRNTKLMDVQLPSTVATIGSGAFSNCTALTSINVPTGTTIGSRAFGGCTSIKSIALNSCNLGAAAFCECSSLKSASLSNIAVFSNDVFAGCRAMSSVNFINPEVITTIGQYAFARTDIREFVMSSTSGVFSNLSTISSGAFRNCIHLSKVLFNYGNIRKIDNDTFASCTDLTSLSLDGISSIEYGAFSSCVNLTILRVPDSVTALRERSFAGCQHISSAYLGSGFLNFVSSEYWDSRAIASNVFEGCNALTYISCNFSSGAVPGAPWGATATVVYKQ